MHDTQPRRNRNPLRVFCGCVRTDPEYRARLLENAPAACEELGSKRHSNRLRAAELCSVQTELLVPVLQLPLQIRRPARSCWWWRTPLLYTTSSCVRCALASRLLSWAGPLTGTRAAATAAAPCASRARYWQSLGCRLRRKSRFECMTRPLTVAISSSQRGQRGRTTGQQRSYRHLSHEIRWSGLPWLDLRIPLPCRPSAGDTK